MSLTKRKKKKKKEKSSHFPALILLGAALILPGCSRKPEPERTDNEGHRMILLAKVAEILDATIGSERLDDHDAITLSRGATRLDFHPTTAVIHANGTPVFSAAPSTLIDGHVYIRSSDVERIVKPLLRPDLLPRRGPVRRILIDPGHGGKDPGAVNPEFDLREKDLALGTARRLARSLHQAGFVVALTRNDDRFVPLDERPASAIDFDADLFLSIHFNAATNTGANGIEVFTLTPAAGDSSEAELPGNRTDEWNTLLGYSIQESLVHATGQPDRGVKRARFAVLRTLRCPGVLIEGGFISNPGDARQLQFEDRWQQLADGIARGVERYCERLERDGP